MRTALLAALLAGTASPLPALAQSPAPAPASTAPIAVAPLAFTERVLPNGLRVFAISDPNTANVAVQVWYDVGAKDDPRGRSGFAHMFEHLMFKATRNLVPEQLDRLTEDVGGYNNASTSEDYTNYFELVPANHLERLLFAEADRMASLVVDPATFASEREVVKEELRSRVLAQPYGKLFYQYLPTISYARHPYARPAIGSIADLDAATLDDIRAFHATYYRPDNAVLVVAGNFDAAQLDRWVDRYFARIARPGRPIPRVTVTEPVRSAPVTRTVYEANTPLPAVLISFPLPAANHPDLPALSILTAILSQGDSSRLHQSLVYRDQLAQDVGVIADVKKGAGNLAAYAILAGGKDVAQGEAALRRELAAIAARPVTAAELAEAKNEIVTEALLGRETAEGKAFALAEGVIVQGDPRAADKELAAIARVTAADVQRVARTWLAPQRAAAIRYLPETGKPAGASSDTIALASTVVTAPLAVPTGIPTVTPAPAGERVLPPQPGTPIVARLPQPIERRLSNGMRVVLVEKHDLPIASASLIVPSGTAADPAGRAGVNSLAADLVTKGTATRSATQIAQAVEALGGAIASGADSDSSTVSVTVGSRDAAAGVDILADVARNPAFAQEELDRSRSRTIDGVQVALSDPGALSGLVSARAVFGDSGYGAPQQGTPQSLAAITRADVVAAYRAHWRPQTATLVLVGDLSEQQAMGLAQRAFGDWRAPAGSNPPTPKVAASPARPRVIVVDLPGAGQAGVAVARPAIARDDPGYYAASVANAALGVGFSSRLNQEIRIKRGLAYGASSQLDARRAAGPLTLATQTKNESAPEVVGIMAAELTRLGREPAAEAELQTRKAVLTGNFGRNTERTSGIASTLASYIAKGVPLTELSRFVPATNAVTPSQVQAAAARHFDPAAASIVVVGDSKLFIDQLRKTYPQVELIPVSALDLDQAGLKKLP